jgi:hypothetical protein
VPVRSFAVVGADDLAAKQAVKAAGVTHAVVPARWSALQPNGAGTALDATALADLNTQLADCHATGLRVILEHALQYPPTWVLSGVEAFRDQASNDWLDTSSGKQVRNWMWTANGRSYYTDFINRVAAGITDRGVVDRIRFGAVASPNSYWGFGTSMQTGTGLASGLSVCPLPGYTPFSGTDSQDVQWINWYLGGIESWLAFQVTTLKTAGWRVPLMCLHPGYSTRSNQTRASSGYRQDMAYGHDFTRALGVYKNDPQVWPWSTWINGTDFPSPPTVDSDQAAWKKLYAEAVGRGKHGMLWGENTGGEDNTGMDFIFANPLATGTPATGEPLYGPRARAAWSGYVGLMWLNYADLTAGGSHATLAHYAAKIAGQ